MKKAFDGQGREIGGGELEEILVAVLDNLSVTVPLTVERVQDEVERTLMERGHYEVAKAYILYREKPTILKESIMVLLSISFENMHQILRNLYDTMTKLCHPMMDMAMAVSYTHLDVYKRQR